MLLFERAIDGWGLEDLVDGRVITGVLLVEDEHLTDDGRACVGIDRGVSPEVYGLSLNRVPGAGRLVGTLGAVCNRIDGIGSRSRGSGRAGVHKLLFDVDETFEELSHVPGLLSEGECGAHTGGFLSITAAAKILSAVCHYFSSRRKDFFLRELRRRSNCDDFFFSQHAINGDQYNSVKQGAGRCERRPRVLRGLRTTAVDHG